MENMETETRSTASGRHPLLMPAVVFAGFLLVAAAIFFSGTGMQKLNMGGNNTPNNEEPLVSEVTPINEDDHILGNPNAPIVLVEYSDYDCPFCKQFHSTMNRIMDEYGSTGKVAWVYRHFPIQQLHPNAPTIAHASECVADLAGNDAFWTFSDLIFDERGTNEPTNVARLTEFATTAGADQAAFESCMDEGTFIQDVEDDLNNAAASGVRGTPHTFVLVAGQQTEINGAQPYETVKSLIDTIISQIESGN